MLIFLLTDSNNVWKVTIPQGLAGPHVLRTEAFALMGAGNLGHAQLYPQCINLDIAGSGGVDPCTSGADCRLGKDLYKETDPGIYISIHTGIEKYIIPGPAVWKGTSNENPNKNSSSQDEMSSQQSLKQSTSKRKSPKFKQTSHERTMHKNAAT